MNKKILALILTFVMLLGLSSCGSNSGNSDLEDFEVVLEWYPNAAHGYIYTAIEKGYFEEEGLNVKVNFPAGTSDGISMPAAGKTDIGIYYLSDSLEAMINEDIPVVSVGSIIQKSLNVVISLGDDGIKGPADLKGKTVGYSSNPLAEAQIKTCLETAGLTMDDITLIDVGWDLMPAMTTGQVDATIGCMVNHEVVQLEEEGFDVNYFYPTDFGVPATYELIFLANAKDAEENPAKIQKFLRGVQKGFNYMKENPEETVDILLANQDQANFPLSKTVEMKSAEIIIPFMETSNSPFLSQDLSVWQNNADWLYDNGIVKKKVDASKYVLDLLDSNK
ncbi:MAG: ABC transporter substrate-binding protein [Eubacteriales bacterium]|nr:ABC transporter substrate-binding protein [Eubacteriales bacterium]MDD4389193.1 ABC transporter substrate-binding protein [Eubacteriales bacterium]